MHPFIEELLQKNTVRCADGRIRPLSAHLPAFEGEILQTWVREMRPSSLLEVGLACGLSSLFICDALDGRSISSYYIIDPNQSTTWRGAGLENLEQAGWREYASVLEEPSEHALPRLLGEGLMLDFAYIDGFHTFDHALMDFFFINRMLQVGGMVVFDDVHLPALARLMSHIATYPCYEPLSLPDVFAKSRVARVRRMAGVPASRIAAFRKTAEDIRDELWHEEF